MRGPLDILKETWKTSKRSTESVVSYVLDIQEKLARMSELVVDNLKEAHAVATEKMVRLQREDEGVQGRRPGPRIAAIINQQVASELARAICGKEKVVRRHV